MNGPLVTKDNWHEIDCPGEAHSNAFIDHCMLCAPKWGKIVVPRFLKSTEEFHEWWIWLNKKEQDQYGKDKEAYLKSLEKQSYSMEDCEDCHETNE